MARNRRARNAESKTEPTLAEQTFSRIQARKWIRSALDVCVRQMLGPDVDLVMVAECLEGMAAALRLDYEQRKRAERRASAGG